MHYRAHCAIYPDENLLAKIPASRTAPRTKSVFIQNNLCGNNLTPRAATGLDRQPICIDINNQWKNLLSKRPASLRSSSFSFGRAASRQAIARYLSGRGRLIVPTSSPVPRPERIPCAYPSRTSRPSAAHPCAAPARPPIATASPAITAAPH